MLMIFQLKKENTQKPQLFVYYLDLYIMYIFKFKFFKFIFKPLYFPCIYSFWKNKAKNPCYILLIYLSLMDICLLWVPTFAAGIFSLNGVVYCSSPFLTYFVGCDILFFWAPECSADLILGINRCLEIAFPNISKKLFHNNRVYFWLIFCSLYGFYWLLFRHPCIFNGINFVFAYDPLIGYKPFRIEFFGQDLLEITLHNYILAIGSPIIYILFAFCLIFKFRALSNKITKEEILVFIQVFIISMFNSSCGIISSYIVNNPDSGFNLQMDTRSRSSTSYLFIIKQNS
uniref:7TM GPCR serpentine receptor class x (Srx) domain-containing protein n=1 Tax=Meloidogyne incognita TaxID=6306 RepID=A0A914NK91_MELIC